MDRLVTLLGLHFDSFCEILEHLVRNLKNPDFAGLAGRSCFKALTLSTRQVLTKFAVIFRPNSKLEGVCGSNLAESDGMGN